jgi:hypothetical protein
MDGGRGWMNKQMGKFVRTRPSRRQQLDFVGQPTQNFDITSLILPDAGGKSNIFCDYGFAKLNLNNHYGNSHVFAAADGVRQN